MHRTLATLTLAAASIAVLTGCVIAVPWDEYDPSSFDPELGDYDADYAPEADFLEAVDAGLQSIDSDALPAAGSNALAFEAFVFEVGWLSCGGLVQQSQGSGDPYLFQVGSGEHAWSSEELDVVAAAADEHLCDQF